MLCRFLGNARGLCVALLIAGVAWAAPASAQIYTWRDANGHLVLSNVRTESGAPVAPTKTYAVPRAETVRATRWVAVDRGWQYENLITEHSRLNDVRSDLVRAVMQIESAFNPYAISPKGAMGLMQLMPATMRQYGVINAFNPSENVRAGVAYLRALLDRYSNNEELALAAYNAGPGAVDKHGQAVPPYRETKAYVAKIDKMVGTGGGRVEERPNKIYKVVQVIDGREIPLYTDKKPANP
jgi:soluble lytic murein transglycosylase-like protein